MFQKLSKKLRKRQGFTLIELIVVLAILGIILAIAVPNYLGVQQRAAADADIRTSELVEKAIKLWWTMDDDVTATAFVLTAAMGDHDSDATTADTMPDDFDLTGEDTSTITQADVNEIVPQFLETIPESQAGSTTLTVTVTAGEAGEINISVAYS